MDSAIHKETSKEYLAITIWNKIGLFKDICTENWIASPDIIENYEKEIPVVPVKPYTRSDGIHVRPFFRLYPNCADQVIFKQESEKHKKLKGVVLDLLYEENDCKLKYDSDLYSIKDLPVDYQKLNNTKKLEVRKNITTTGDYKVADIRIPFIYSTFWGSGLVIEIRVSERPDTQEAIEKENFWFQRGFSFMWLEETDFVEIDNRYYLKNKVMNVIPHSIGYKQTLDYYTNTMSNYLHQGWEHLEKERAELNNDKYQFKKELAELPMRLKKTCRTCIQGCKHRENPELIACFIDTVWGKNGRKGNKRHPIVHEPLDSCEFWSQPGEEIKWA